MKAILAAALAAMTMVACADLPNSSRVTHAMPLLDTSTIGGPGFPVVITGAEVVGLSEAALADSLAFPAFMRADSSFRAARHEPGMVNHAHLDISPSGENASATLTFLHGERRIGAGVFTLPIGAYSNPRAVSGISAPLISSMLRRAQEFQRDSKDAIWIPN